tara:strand:- start:2202 stop:3122 length:921 start_codon:yes stop_codon:yes gene_type:complete
MKIAFFTEMDFTGKIPRTHENMRTEFAWMVALNADHYNINSLPSKPYDLGIVIIPKKNPNFDLQKLKTICSKVAVMQEGPHWYFQDYPLEKQIWYYNTLIESDIIFTHNESDKIYYQGLTEHKDVRVMKSLMIEDAVGKLDDVKRKGVIIGGNFVNWYGGFDSFIVAQEIENIIYAPSMGRKQPGEEQFVNHLPYMNWKQWIHKLNEFEIGVHLMRTHAAGTFSLNCAYLGIPCIGYEGLDTQEKCHPDLTVKLGDLKKAKELIKKLRDDKEFYLSCSNKSKNNYKQYFKEEIYKVEWEKIIKTVK